MGYYECNIWVSMTLNAKVNTITQTSVNPVLGSVEICYVCKQLEIANARHLTKKARYDL